MSEDEKWSQATLAIHSERVTDEEIAATLGLRATRTHSKGQPRGKAGGRTFVFKDWAWLLSSPMGGDPDLVRHLKWLLDTIEPKLEALGMLRANCRVVLSCGFSSGNGQGGFTLDTDTLGRIARLGIPLVLDLYPPTADLDDEGVIEQNDSTV